MSTNIIKIDRKFIDKWPTLKEFMDVRPGIKCLGLQVNSEIEAVALVSAGRIYHVHTRPESRRMKYASKLLTYISVNLKGVDDSIRAAVDTDNKAAIAMFVDNGYMFIGFDVTNNCNKCLMSLGHKSRHSRIDTLSDMKMEFEDMANRLYVIEALPFKHSK